MTTDRAEQDLCRRVARQVRDPLGVGSIKTTELWSVIGDDSRNLHVVQADAPHMRVCFLTSDGPTEERAALIAAAPDMLQALKAMTEEWVDYMTINNIPGDPWAKHNMRLAKAAIDKAEAR